MLDILTGVKHPEILRFRRELQLLETGDDEVTGGGEQELDGIERCQRAVGRAFTTDGRDLPGRLHARRGLIQFLKRLGLQTEPVHELAEKHRVEPLDVEIAVLLVEIAHQQKARSVVPDMTDGRRQEKRKLEAEWLKLAGQQ